ncbi:MAG: peptidylprolyl isomerase [Pyrinomonadaceae bacterium]
MADNEQAIIETDFGDITMELYSNLAPLMVERFKQLAKEGFYDGTTFHRIDPNLGIIQGGDPLSKDSDPANDGTGGSNYPDVPQEFSDVPYDAGTIGAARSNSPDSANCQFFITLKRQSGFDERYTIFGRVVSGLNNAQVISTAPTEAGTARPLNPIVIKRITMKQK